MKIPVKRQVPPGSYRATFFQVEAKVHPEYGLGNLWSFDITSGNFKSERVFQDDPIAGDSQNATGKFLTALTGLPLDQAANVDLERFAGTPCMVNVVIGDTGTTRVENFIVEKPPEDEEPPAAVTVPF